jgi:membrane fusion protein (multidrug efflux system)
LDSARAKFEGARALLAKARESAGDYSVEAPWNGVVSKVLVKDGDFVAPRTPLLEMYAPASLVIRFAVPETQATQVFKGMPVTVHLDAHPDKDFQGRISRVYPDLDTKSRTRTVEAKLDYPIALIPGMFARLKLPLQTVAEATVVPREAVTVTPNGERIAFVIKEESPAAKLKPGLKAMARCRSSPACNRVKRSSSPVMKSSETAWRSKPRVETASENHRLRRQAAHCHQRHRHRPDRLGDLWLY